LLKVIMGVVIAAATSGCVGVGNSPAPGPPDLGPQLHVQGSPSPYSQVTIGPVQGLVPDGWKTFAATTEGDVQNGFVATPEPAAWKRMDGSAVGMTATWVDATRVGVPSDFYYLAATGPLLSGLTHSIGCVARSHQIFVNERPTFESGPPGSAGDYVASGRGTCHIRGRLTQWAYFVAAPGFGPVREIGIKSSGLYVIVIVLPRSHSGAVTMRQLLDHTSFAGAGISDIVRAARSLRTA
jgi:hypothetical protein